MSVNDYIKEFNAELDRLKKIIPGLKCSDLVTQQGQFGVLIGCVDSEYTKFAVTWTEEGPQILVARLLDGHITLMNRLYENIVALENMQKNINI